MKLSDLRPLINDGDWIAHREDCGYRHAHHVGMPCDCGADHVSAALPLLLRVAEAAKAYRDAERAWMAGDIKGAAPTVLNEREDALFAALAALDEVQP